MPTVPTEGTKSTVIHHPQKVALVTWRRGEPQAVREAYDKMQEVKS